MTLEELALLVEEMPLAVKDGMSDDQVEWMMAGHQQARSLAASAIRDFPEDRPLVIA